MSNLTHLLQNKTIAVLNLGCKVNSYETHAMKQKLEAEGAKEVPFQSIADIYVINTCTVTNEASRKSRQMIRKARRNNPAALIIATGCDVELKNEHQDADILIGNTGKTDILEHIKEYFNRRQNVEHISLNDAIIPIRQIKEFEEMGIVVSEQETRGVIKIQDGCNQFCSYCAIPFARGQVRSRSLDSILYEAKELATLGFKEIILTGIHICSYGIDLKQTITLFDLCDELAKINGISRIRLGSLEPKSITKEVAIQFGKNKKLCPHAHLSLQSGCNQTLKMMKRPYSSTDYKRAVNDLRTYVNHIQFTTDIIVGFPGETDKDHQESLSFCKEIGFSKIHVFRFSPREGTLAYRLPNRIVGSVMEFRSKEFLKLSNDSTKRIQQSLAATKANVLLEQKTKDGYWTGYTEHYIPVEVEILSDKQINLTKNWSGKIVQIRLENQGKSSMKASFIADDDKYMIK